MWRRWTTFIVRLDAATGKEVWAKPVGDYKKEPLPDARSAGHQRQDHRWHVGRARWACAATSRPTTPRREIRCGAPYTIPGPGEARPRDMERRCLEERRCHRMDDRQLRSGHPYRLLGHRQSRAVAGDLHPGDNLYTTSVIGLDPDTGKIKNHFQYRPNDSWDWDEVDPPILMDLQSGGRTIKALVHPGRDGYLWTLERTPEKINYCSRRPTSIKTCVRQASTQRRGALNTTRRRYAQGQQGTSRSARHSGAKQGLAIGKLRSQEPAAPSFRRTTISAAAGSVRRSRLSKASCGWERRLKKLDLSLPTKLELPE